MWRVLSGFLAAVSVVLGGGEADAAEAYRLRYVAAIYLDDKGGGLRHPEGVACDDKSSLVVADTGRGRLVRFSVEDREVKALGEIAAPQLSSPIRVQMSSKGEIFVLDGMRRRILRFGATGEPKGYLEPEGVPEPTSIVPRSFAIGQNDFIYVLDVFSARVLLLDRDGKYQRHVPFPAGYGFFSDLAVDSKGTIFILDSVKATVHAAARDARDFSPLAKALRPYLSFPTSLAVDSRGTLFLVDEHGGGIVLVGQDGAVLGRQLAMGRTDGLLYFPSQVCLNGKGQVFIADRGNSRVQVFSIAR